MIFQVKIRIFQVVSVSEFFFHIQHFLEKNNAKIASLQHASQSLVLHTAQECTSRDANEVHTLRVNMEKKYFT